ncbi:sulfatase family protein [Cerasicoccus fimbriatus]|uniref:sulfatase family protein n=1 Tax=Cerasicoccus fimbriatus TaxID=3014554 RepID=UPI0022B5AFA0|nr:sulfatase-like hydrolase/transferase [Cerasicoccus sp. TK19100]
MPPPPNILFIFTDQQHWQAISERDVTFRTPNLDRLSAVSTVFSRAYCPTPQCSPSRSSIMTGLYPSKTGVMGNVGAKGGEPLRMQTIAPALQRAGYYTGYFGKWHLGSEAIAQAGWDVADGPGLGEAFNDPNTTQRSVEFLQTAPEDKPFALYVSLNDPHDIYHIPKVMHEPPSGEAPLPTSWSKDHAKTAKAQGQFMREDQGKVIVDEPEQSWLRYREYYREKVALVDGRIGEVLDALEQTGRAENTLIVFTSDHGDQDTQQRLIFKGPFMYDYTLRVPLMIKLPGQTARRECAFPSVNVDLVPTLAEVAGAVIGAVDGVSLLPLLTGQGEPPTREFVFAQYYSKQQWVNPIRTVVGERYKYNRYLSGEEELYDFDADPGEMNNLAANPGHADVKGALLGALEKWMLANDDPFYTLGHTDRDGNPIERHV